MKFFTNEVKIALVVIVGIVLLFFGMNFLKGKSFFSNEKTYYARFDNLDGLSASNPIYADGFQVGAVSSISYDYEGNGGAIVKFSVNKNLRIPKGSTAEIESDLMGNIKMNLLLTGNPTVIMEPGDTVVGNLKAGIMGAVGELMPTVQSILPKVDSILNSVNKLMADPAIAGSLHNIQSISGELKTTSANLNALVAGLNNRVPGMVGKADQALDKVNVTLDNTSKFTSSLATVDVVGTMNKVNETLNNVQAVTARLNSNEGSLGLLMNDASLYHNLNSTVQSADSLLTNFKAHPKRYIHFSVFGKKDK